MCAYADAVAGLDVFLIIDGAPDARCCADYLVPDNAGIICWGPARADGVDVTAADATVGNLDFNVGFLKRFGSEGSVRQGGFRVVRDPACECIWHCP